MEQEDAGWSDLTESNGALDFTSDLRERPEPTALDFSVRIVVFLRDGGQQPPLESEPFSSLFSVLSHSYVA